MLITAAWIILLVVWHSSESIKRPMSLVKNCQWIVPLFLIFGSMDAKIEIARVSNVTNLPELACCCTSLVLLGRFWVAGFDMFTIRLLFFSTVSNSSNFCKSKKVFTHSLWIKTIVYEYAPTSWQFLHPLHLSKDVESDLKQKWIEFENMPDTNTKTSFTSHKNFFVYEGSTFLSILGMSNKGLILNWFFLRSKVVRDIGMKCFTIN